MAAARVLDVGCGRAKEPGSVGVDRFALAGVDVVCDLDTHWPFPDASFERVIFRHSICHMRSLENALREARRVCVPGATVEIISPHFSSDNAFTDPTMQFSTGYRTLDYYCENGSMAYGYYGQVGFRISKRRIYLYRSTVRNSRQRVVSFLFWPFDVFANCFPRFYESSRASLCEPMRCTSNWSRFDAAGG